MVGTPRFVAEMSLGHFRLSRKELAMDGTLMTDAELKDILLTLAKSGAPKPKEGTALGDALVRFTTAADGAGLLCDGFKAEQTEKPPLKSFLVTLNVIRTIEMDFEVEAESAEEASKLAESYGVEEDMSEGDARYLKTHVGLRKFCFENAGWFDYDITTIHTEEIPADEQEYVADL
jgi:hypothetical protein